MVAMGCYTFTPKTAPSPSMIITPSNTPLPRPTHSPPQTASGSNQTFCHSTLSRHTDRLRDGIGNKPVRIPACALLIV